MKVHTQKRVPDADCGRDADPIEEVMTANVQQCLRVSDADAGTLKQSPPSPTPELQDRHFGG